MREKLSRRFARTIRAETGWADRLAPGGALWHAILSEKQGVKGGAGMIGKKWGGVLALILAAVAAAPATATEEAKAADRLLEDLMALPAFRSLIPPNRTVQRLVYEGDIDWRNFRYDRVPETVPKQPRAIDTYTVRNCDSSETLMATGVLEGERTETASLTTTQGWEIGATVGFDIGFPLVGKTKWTFSGKYSGSTAIMDQEAKRTAVKHGYRSVAQPLTEHDLQMVVLEEAVDGVPYRFDLVLDGTVRVYHDLDSLWLPKSRLADAFIGSDEPVGDSRRELPVCRASHAGAQHPGKVVAGNCNITYGGKELRKRNFRVLFASPGLAISAETYSGGAKPDQGLVAGTERSRACEPGRANYQQCLEENPQEGKLTVCFAQHKVFLDDRGWHPGKLVRRHCMIGYGGEELEKSVYKILTYAGDPEDSFVVNASDYLPPERTVFTVEGLFSGAYVGEAELVRGDSRAADEAICAQVGGQTVAWPADDAATSEPPAYSAAATASPDTAARFAARRSAGPAPTQAPQPLIDGVVVARGALDGDGEGLPLVVRELRLEQPLLFGDDVAAVQEALADRGWRLKTDGYYGPKTESAVRDFQLANGLPADGVVGGETLYWLGLSDRTAPGPHDLPRAERADEVS